MNLSNKLYSGVIYSLLFSIVISCKPNYDTYMIDEQMNCVGSNANSVAPLLKHTTLRADKIVMERKVNDCQCYKRQDTTVIEFNLGGSDRLFIFLLSGEKKFLSAIQFQTDLIGRYDDGQYSGTYLDLTTKASQVKIKREVFKNDRLCGYINMQSESYQSFGIKYNDRFRGYFNCWMK